MNASIEVYDKGTLIAIQAMQSIEDARSMRDFYDATFGYWCIIVY